MTLDAHDSIAQAIAVRTGVIVAVGADRDILRLAGTATQIIDLHGRMATPGLIDSHAHIAEGGIGELYDVQLTDATSVEEIVHRVQLGIATLKPGEWLLGDGWDEGKLTERRYVLAEDLDKVSPDNPVWLGHTSGHYGVANSYALRMAQITADTADPSAGMIDRDPKGHPTGVLKESAMKLVVNLIPPPTPEQRRAGILHSIETLHKEGITAVKDPAIDAPTWDAYRQLLSDGQFEHVCVLWNAGVTLASAKEALALIEAQPKPPASLGHGRLLSCGAKIFIDGSGGARTAWVYKEWNNRSRYWQFWLSLYGPGRLSAASAALSPGRNPYRNPCDRRSRNRHGSGHLRCDTQGDTDTRPQTQHHPCKHPERSCHSSNGGAGKTIRRRLSGNASAIYVVDRGFVCRQLRARTFIAAHAIQDLFTTRNSLGGRFGLPRDAVPARFGLWASAERETLKGTYGAHPFGTTESSDIHQALRSYTTWAARQLFLEHRIGSVQKGKDADIAIWDQDMYEMPTTKLRDLHCEMTIFHGKIVYQASEP